MASTINVSAKTMNPIDDEKTAGDEPALKVDEGIVLTEVGADWLARKLEEPTVRNQNFLAAQEDYRKRRRSIE